MSSAQFEVHIFFRGFHLCLAFVVSYLVHDDKHPNKNEIEAETAEWLEGTVDKKRVYCPMSWLLCYQVTVELCLLLLSVTLPQIS